MFLKTGLSDFSLGINHLARLLKSAEFQVPSTDSGFIGSGGGPGICMLNTLLNFFFAFLYALGSFK
jgi:hypothetical protein